LMADIVARSSALMISTDSIITSTTDDFDCPALDALRSVGSHLPVECTGDAAFIARSRTYAILKRPENIKPKDRIVGRPDQEWALVKAARHGAVESEDEFAETVLACLKAGKDVAPVRKPKRLLGAEEAVRTNRGIFDEVTSERRTFFTWDTKRRLLDRDVNPFTSMSRTRPYRSVRRLDAAEHQRLVRRGEARRRRRPTSRKKLEVVFALLREGVGVREISRRTGVPKSTVADLRARMSRAASSEEGENDDVQ